VILLREKEKKSVLEDRKIDAKGINRKRGKRE